MASSNRLVVEVVGDTSKLTKDLNKATAEINRFAGRSKIGTKGSPADALLADVRGLRKEADALVEKEAAVSRQTDIVNSRLAGTALRAGVAAVAVHVFGANLNELGGNAGKIGGALEKLSSGNIVGFVKGLQSINEADPAQIGADLLKYGDAAKASEVSSQAAALGMDKLAASAKAASDAIRDNTNAFVDNTKIRDSTSPGAIALETSSIASARTKTRPGISQSQRNTFFDNDLTRALDRAQDGSLKQQVAKLREVEATLRERLKVTKDITRQLTLEDEIADVQRKRRSIEDTIAQNAKDRAAAAARLAAELKKERAAREQALEEARRVALQSKQFRALGFAADGSEVIPGADNLRKQLASLTARLGSSSVNLSSKLENQLEGVRKVLAGKFGTVTRESREKIQELFETIRREFDKGGKSGPLTKTTALNTNSILRGLGLSPEDERALKARLSQFNSGGRALAAGPGSVGAFGQPIVVQSPPVYLDGAKISGNTTRHQQRNVQANPTQKRGSR